MEDWNERLKAQYEYDGAMRCPFCGSKHLYIRNRGYNWTYGCLGAIILNIFGLLFGFIGSKKEIWGCKNCGKEWQI